MVVGRPTPLSKIMIATSAAWAPNVSMPKFAKLMSMYGAASVAVAHSFGKSAPSQDAVSGAMDSRLAAEIVPLLEPAEIVEARPSIATRVSETIALEIEESEGR